MDLKHLVLLALKISVFTMVFGFGLRATSKDLLYLLRRPGLLVRSLIAVLVIMPAVAVAMARWFDLRQTAAVTLLALSISPVPPLLPKKIAQAAGQQSYGL